MSPVSEDGTCPVCGLTAGAYQPAPHHIPPGTILLNRYLFGRVLGEGGFGITYIACDLRLDLKVAIKEYFPTDKATRHAPSSLDVTTYTGMATNDYENYKRKFLAEARTMAKMDKQPEIVSVRDFFELNNTAYIVMEFVDGTTFRELVKQQGGKIPAQQLLTIIEPLFGALSAMHAAGLVHRDISPDNLMLEHGKVRLLDFGCARESTTGTDTLTIALKHGFAPIEQYTNHGQGPWTDIYALAGTIYFCITGKAPVRSTDRLLGDELILPSKLGIDLSRQQERALLRAMAIQPRRRFQTAEEFHAALYAPEEDPIFPEPDEEPEQIIESIHFAEETEPAPRPLPKTEKLSPKAPVQEPPTQKAAVPNTPAATKHRQKKKSYRSLNMTLGISAVALVLLLICVALWGSGSSDVPADNTGDYAVDTVPVNDTAQPYLLESNMIGDGAKNYELFLNALEDPSVSEIHIIGGGLVEAPEYVQTVISKPVYLESGDLICYFPVEIVEGGHLIIDDTFSSMGYIRTQGGGKVTLRENCSASFMGMIWLENSSDLDAPENEMTHLWVFSEAEARKSITQVTDWARLKNLMDHTIDNIVIDADITVSTETWGVYDRTIIISPGVTVTSEAEDFTVRGNLINYGTLILNDEVDVIDEGGHLVNFGTLEISAPNDLHISDEGSVLLNLGTLVTGDQTRCNLDASLSLVNMGSFEANAGISCAGSLLNSGSITAFGSSDESALYNYGAVANWGTVTLMGGELANCGYFLNGGDLNAEYIGNVGFLDECTQYISPEGQVSYESIDNGRGIYATKNSGSIDAINGIVDLSGNVPSGDADSIYEAIRRQNFIQVTTQEELVAYANSDYDWIVVASNITCSRSVELSCDLLVMPGWTLSFDEGATLYVRDATVCVGGSLCAEYLYFEFGSRLLANTGSRWSVTGGTLALQRGATCYISEGSSVEVEKFIATDYSMAIIHGGTLRCSQAAQIKTGSRLMLADRLSGGNCTLETPELLIWDARLVNLSQLELQNTNITFDNADMDNLRALTILESDISIPSGSNLWCSHVAPLDIRSNSTLNNAGTLQADGEAWLYCDTVNTGYMEFSTLYVSGSLVNNGTVRLIELVDYGNVFTGNAPEKWD